MQMRRGRSKEVRLSALTRGILVEFDRRKMIDSEKDMIPDAATPLARAREAFERHGLSIRPLSVLAAENAAQAAGG